MIDLGDDPDGDIEGYDGRIDCSAALNIRGEHFQCDLPLGHGDAHSNKKAEAIWRGNDNNDS
jgi:hypothetical protein